MLIFGTIQYINIRKVINQAYRNHDLEIFKKMYNSILAKSLDSEHSDNNIDKNNSESNSDSDLEETENEANNNVIMTQI